MDSVYSLVCSHARVATQREVSTCVVGNNTVPYQDRPQPNCGGYSLGVGLLHVARRWVRGHCSLHAMPFRLQHWTSPLRVRTPPLVGEVFRARYVKLC